MARKKKLLFIYNPHAGKERIRSQLIAKQRALTGLQGGQGL